MNRRDFLKSAALGLAAAASASSSRFLQAANSAGAPSHFVPADKNLKPEWVRSLFARGSKEVFRGADLRFIGMPVGGIGTGQLYLCGDGTLGNWEIFNRHEYFGTGELNYFPRPHTKPVDQGFAVVVAGDGKSMVRGLPQDRLLSRSEKTRLGKRGLLNSSLISAGAPLGLHVAGQSRAPQ